MNKAILIMLISIMPSVLMANQTREERKKARQENRMNKEVFDNRTSKQKLRDTKVLSIVALIAVLIFRKTDDAYRQ